MRARPENVATPELATAVLFDTDTPPEVMVAVTVEPSPVTTLPPESSTLTTGWVASAAPLLSVVEPGVVMTSWVGAPVAMAMLAEATELTESPVKVSW